VSAVPATVAKVQFLGVWCEKLAFEDRAFELSLQGKAPPPDQSLGDAEFVPSSQVWTKRRNPDDPNNEAFVRLTFALEPRVQPSYRVEVSYIGWFRAAVDSPIPFEAFTSRIAMTYLVPYLRSKISEATGESRFPRYLLPPLDMDALVKLINAENAEKAGLASGELSTISVELEVPEST
jgi:preprotein translocase subunit SecB